MRYKLSYLLIGLTALAICSAIAKEVYFQPPNLIAVESFSQAGIMATMASLL